MRLGPTWRDLFLVAKKQQQQNLHSLNIIK